jgi:hypothetical protein
MKKICILTLFIFNVTLCYKWNRHSCDTFGTHQPVLYTMAMKTSGPIIEFGCGDSSTDLLHEICKKDNRILISIDDNLEWLNKFKGKYIGDGYEPDNSGWHKFYYVPGKKDDLNPDHWIKFLDEFELLNTFTFELCFVDQSPWLGRYETIKRLGSKIKYIILHDCDFFPVYNVFGKTIQPTNYTTQTEGIFDYSDVFTFFKIYYPSKPWPGFSGPPTLLASNFESDFPDVDFANY